MTLPKNFPGRKNQRRADAAKRKGKPEDIENVKKKVVEQSVAVAIKTKKVTGNKRVTSKGNSNAKTT